MSRRAVDLTILLAGILALWQLFYAWAGPDAMASPLQTAAHLLALLRDPRFWGHTAATAIAFAYACVISLLGGLALGVALGLRRIAGDVAGPILGTLYSIPKITLYPLILLIFGLGLSAKVAFGALHGIFPVTLFAMGAIRNINPVFVKTAHVMQLSRSQVALTILIPAALPEIVTGLRIGFSAALLGTIIGELFASNQGLGYMLIRAVDLHNVAEIMAVTLFLFVFAVLANALLAALERRLYHHAVATATLG